MGIPSCLETSERAIGQTSEAPGTRRPKRSITSKILERKADPMSISSTASLRRPSGLSLLAVALVGATGAASLTLASTASAGVIPDDTPVSGWNLDNVTLTLNGDGSSFDPTDGSYVWGLDTDHTYQAAIDNGAGDVLGIVLAKDGRSENLPASRSSTTTSRLTKQLGPPTASCPRRISNQISSTLPSRSRFSVVDRSSRTSATSLRCSRQRSTWSRRRRRN